MIRTATIPMQYRRPFFQGMERTFLNTLRGSATLAAVFLVVVYVAPQRTQEPTSVDELPERFARLILEEPAPAPAPVVPDAPAAPAPEVVEATPPPQPVAKPQPRPRRDAPVVPKDRGTEGRKRAETVVAKNLAQVDKTLDNALDKLSSSLPATETASKPKRRTRGRNVRKARGSSDVAAVGSASTGASADLSGSAVEGSLVAIDAIADVVVSDDTGVGTGGSGTGGNGEGELRSSSSLLQVVRRYAAGIQYCYDQELKADPGLKGKLVVSITVGPSGKVLAAQVVEDTLRSADARSCVLSQINGWSFPAIEAGEVTFKTPFVFTPPK